ncbi:hypothetical protein B0F90DRAFT_1378643 [Multifurca ochricompacta]|uniref:Uncharacterized protein n=1 Tax=Multifurca ochricompacta TaxID=376703 RepID=A0AAD4M6V5_9AGAM|nr:hypothetical protein B0F90DRAFT_1378643 [Multifurca ochricompacta]
MVFTSKGLLHTTSVRPSITLPPLLPPKFTIYIVTATTAMVHPIDGVPANFEVHFLHSDDPRHGFCVMSTDPLVYYSFETPIGFLTTHTMVTDATGATIVTFNWFGSSALGTMTDGSGASSCEAHMGELVMPFQSAPDSRAFRCEGPDRIVHTFWWQRRPHGDYDVRTSSEHSRRIYGHGILQLYVAHEPYTLIGLFRRHRPPEVLPVGNNYASFFFRFSHEPLLLCALLALCLNRWLDRQDGLE